MTTEKITDKNVIEQFAPYPRREEDATTEVVYRHLLVSAIVTHFAKQRIRVPKPGEPGRVQALGESVSMSDLFVTEWTALVLFRRLRGLPMEDRDEHLPVTDEAALDLWLGWEDGELAPDLWEWAAEAGLDPDAIGDAFRASLAEEAPMAADPPIGTREIPEWERRFVEDNREKFVPRDPNEPPLRFADLVAAPAGTGSPTPADARAELRAGLTERAWVPQAGDEVPSALRLIDSKEALIVAIAEARDLAQAELSQTRAELSQVQRERDAARQGNDDAIEVLAASLRARVSERDEARMARDAGEKKLSRLDGGLRERGYAEAQDVVSDALGALDAAVQARDEARSALAALRAEHEAARELNTRLGDYLADARQARDAAESLLAALRAGIGKIADDMYDQRQALLNPDLGEGPMLGEWSARLSALADPPAALRALVTDQSPAAATTCGAVTDSEWDLVAQLVCDLDPHGRDVMHHASYSTPQGFVPYQWPWDDDDQSPAAPPSRRDLDTLAAVAHDVIAPGFNWRARTEQVREAYRKAVLAVLDRYNVANGRSTMSQPTTHRREIGNDFAGGSYFDACSCGWEAESRSPVLADVQRDDSAWRAHAGLSPTSDTQTDTGGK